jgi:hypothetical protein
MSPSAPSFDRLQVLVQPCSTMASKCISNLARSMPPSVSPNLLDHGLQVYLQMRSITACKFIPSQPPNVSPNLLDYGLQLNIQTRSITASKCISRPARFRPASSHNHGLQVYLQTRSITASTCASHNSLDYGLQVHL